MKPLVMTPGTLSLFLMCAAMLACQAPKQFADLVLRHGTIYTVDANFSTAQAVAVKNDRIVKVGTNEEIAAWIWKKLKPGLPLLTEVVVAETCTARAVYRGG